VARSYGARIEDLQALRGRRVSRRVAPLCDGISVDAGACGDGALRNGGRLRLLLTGQGARFSGPGNASYGQGKRGSEKWQPCPRIAPARLRNHCSVIGVGGSSVTIC
jgi:hypothetical protein